MKERHREMSDIKKTTFLIYNKCKFLDGATSILISFASINSSLSTYTVQVELKIRLFKIQVVHVSIFGANFCRLFFPQTYVI